MAASATVVLSDVVVRFGRTVVLDRVSLSLGPGDLVGIRGSNGAGKTTLLRLLVNAYRPTAGTRRGPRRSAYVPAVIEPPALAAGVWLTRVPRPQRSDAGGALDALDFDGDLGAPCRELSFGNLRKLMLAEAFSSGEQLVVVDEVSAGLDDAGLAGVRTLVDRARSSARTVVLADQQSRPFPAGTSVIRVAGGVLHPESDDAETGSVILRGPVAARPELLERANELGFAPVEDSP
jgi:ABC-type Mn2+/Zn2+ transport system ATPase subunit